MAALESSSDLMPNAEEEQHQTEDQYKIRQGSR